MYKVLHLFDNSNITNQFSESELGVYVYIKNNMEGIKGISSEQLAQKTYSSPATINRMCKKLGVEGFSHLKHCLVDDLKNAKQNINRSMTSTKTTNLINNVNFEECVDLAKVITEKKMLFVYSVGASNVAAIYLERQLLNIGIKCIDVEQQKMLEKFDDQLLLIISSSGETTRIIDLVNNIKDKHTILSITAKNSSLDKVSKFSFTHNILIDKLDPITREQQIHMLVMINDLVARIQMLKDLPY